MTDFPVVVTEAHGSRFVDVDGHEYVDFCLGDTGAMSGHAPEPTLRAIAEQARRGITLMLPTEDAPVVSAELAARFGLPFWQFALTATDANRFVNSGVLMSYSWVPTVSSTSAATSEPTWADRSRPSPHETPAKKPARKPSPTPVGSSPMTSGTTGTWIRSISRPVISTPSSPVPTTRGSVSKVTASSRVTVSRSMLLNRLAVRGLSDFFASSGSASVTYGPKRPFLAVIISPVSGCLPSSRSTPVGFASSSLAFSRVSSSGGRSSGMLARVGTVSPSLFCTIGGPSRYGP